VDNTLTVKYRYKYSTGGWIGGDGSGWHSDMTITKSGNFYYASAALSGFDYRLSYVFECQAEDQLMTVSSGESSPIKSSPIFHWGENDFKFEVPVAVNGDLDISGVLRMGDKEIPIIQHGEWTPYLNYSAVSSYGERYGWYSKVGDKVIVGFYIEATCGSGYDSQTISISGLPFTPMFCAAGGGMCSGAYVGGGYTFQCFVAEPSECITTRVQACNNTSAGNLSASNGVFYPVGGGVIVLAGTISYISYL